MGAEKPQNPLLFARPGLRALNVAPLEFELMDGVCQPKRGLREDEGYGSFL